MPHRDTEAVAWRANRTAGAGRTGRRRRLIGPTAGVLIAVALCVPATPVAAGDGGSSAPDRLGQWPAPSMRAPDLVELPRLPGATLAVAVDTQSIDVAPEGTVQVTLVIRGADASSRQVLRQAIRCTSAEYRVEGHYQDGAGWVQHAPAGSWQPMGDTPLGRVAWLAARAGVCDGRTLAGPVSEIARRLRSGHERGYE